MAGKVYLVGAGPGDPGLITINGLSCIKQADAIVYDSLAAPSLLNSAPSGCTLIYAGKRAGSHHLSQSEINSLLASLAAEGKTVVRLKGGDPFVFGRGGEEAEFLARQGIECIVIPGISSCCAAPACAGIPVTHRGAASAFHVFAARGSGGGRTDYKSIAAAEGTLVFLMGMERLGEITSALIEAGKDAETPAAVISRGTTGVQKTVTASLGGIAAAAADLPKPGLLVAGEAVRMRRVTAPKEGVLSGVRILATGSERTMPALRAAVRSRGGELTEISLIRTVEVNYEKFAALDIGAYSQILFFSANGVDVFFSYLLKSGRDIRLLAGAEIGAVGMKTACALKERGIIADIVPRGNGSAALARAVKPNGRVLLIRAEAASDEAVKILSQRGIAYTELPVYRTETAAEKKELLNMNADSDYIVFMSGSAARAFAELNETETAARIAVIGPETARAAAEAGIKADIAAKRTDAEGIAEAIVKAELLRRKK